MFDSQLLHWLGPGERRAVIAHELGHILSDHLVYTTALQILLSVTMPLPFFLGIPFRAVRAVLLEWYRAAELTCDRAATLAVRDPQIVCRSLMVISAGMPADELNLDAFMAQAMEYQSWDDPSDRVRRFFNEINQTHPYSVRRVSEIMKWVQSGEYDRIIRGDYRKRGDDTNVREEASDAMEYYAERFQVFKPKALPVAVGDRLRVTANTKSKAGGHKLIPRDDVVLGAGKCCDRTLDVLLDGRQVFRGNPALGS